MEERFFMKFVFEIKIIKTKDGYIDDFTIKGTELESLGAIIKSIDILTKTKNKILSEIVSTDIKTQKKSGDSVYTK